MFGSCETGTHLQACRGSPARACRRAAREDRAVARAERVWLDRQPKVESRAGGCQVGGARRR
eukprot:15460307-Alexandrium_andersonii.AAC.1